MVYNITYRRFWGLEFSVLENILAEEITTVRRISFLMCNM